jgi:hypothetical protein
MIQLPMTSLPDAVSISSMMSRVSNVSPATLDDQLPDTWYSVPAFAGRSTINPEVGSWAAPRTTVTGSALATGAWASTPAHTAIRPSRSDVMTLIVNPPRILNPGHIMPARQKGKRRGQQTLQEGDIETTEPTNDGTSSGTARHAIGGGNE